MKVRSRLHYAILQFIYTPPPPVVDTRRNVWDHCRIRSRSIGTNSRRLYVATFPLHIYLYRLIFVSALGVNSRSKKRVSIIQWIYSPCSGTRVWVDRAVRRICYWNSRRHGALSFYPSFNQRQEEQTLLLPAAQFVRAYVYESRVFVAMVLILIFAEVLGLYGWVSI